MAFHETEIFGVQFKLETLGVEEAAKYLNDVVAAMRKVGSSKRDINDWVKSTGETLKSLGMASDQLKQVLDKFQSKIPKPTNASDASRAATSELETFAKIQNALFKFKAAFRVPRQILRFTEQMARLNIELRMMSYNANMAVSTLTGMGGVLGTFGGSEKDVAQSAKKYEIQKQRAMQGLGFGYLADNAWKYGFSFNLGETQEQRFIRMIGHMQRMSPMQRLAFLEDEGLSESQKQAALYYSDHGGAEAYKARQDALVRYSEGQEDAAKAGFDLKEATTELSLAWRQFKNYVAQSLTPAVTGVVKALTPLVRIISNKVVGTIVALGAAFVAFRAVTWSVSAALAALRRAAQISAVSRRGTSAINMITGLPLGRILRRLGAMFYRFGGRWRSVGMVIRGLGGAGKVFITALGAAAVAAAKMAAVFGACFALGWGIERLVEKIFGLDKNPKELPKVQNSEIADNIEKKGLSKRTLRRWYEEGLSDEEIEKRKQALISRLRAPHDLTQTQAVSMGDYTATHNTNSTTVNNSPNINVVANVTGTGDPEQDGKAIADAAAKGIAQYAQSKMSGVKA